jgi:hypothetical protein
MPELIPVLRSMIGRGNYYSAMCHLRQIMPIEAELAGSVRQVGVNRAFASGQGRLTPVFQPAIPSFRNRWMEDFCRTTYSRQLESFS